MDVETAMGRLAELYARALRLKRAGWSSGEIARELDVDPASVEPLLAIAQAKLRRLIDDPFDTEIAEE